MDTVVLFKDGSIRVAQAGDDVYIFIDKNVAQRTTLVCKDCGIPGVIGPDIDIDLRKALDKINDDALEAATHFADSLNIMPSDAE